MSRKARDWFHIQNAADDPATTEIHIVDVIGSWDDDFWNRLFGEALFGVTARAFVDQLAALPDTVKNIRLHINSPGGDVWGAVNIANALRDQQLSKGRTVETIIDGLAASSASIIAMAGTSIRMADNALMMIHNPWTIAQGNAAEMRRAADMLDTVRGQAVATYQWHSTMSADDIVAAMDAETWMSADEAIANGFATEKVEGLKAAALLDPKAVGAFKVPDKFKARVDALLKKDTPAPTAASATDILSAVEAAGLSTAFARELVAAAIPMDQVSARIATAKADKQQRETRANEITALCQAVKLPELAAGYIAGAMPPADVRAHLTIVTAKLDRTEIDGGLSPDASTKTATAVDKALDTKAVYAQRNGKQE
jgi:ATP-dependent protease ClpP protease subunit